MTVRPAVETVAVGTFGNQLTVKRNDTANFFVVYADDSSPVNNSAMGLAVRVPLLYRSSNPMGAVGLDNVAEPVVSVETKYEFGEATHAAEGGEYSLYHRLPLEKLS
ncbi:MAG: hypothetical protein Q7V57_17245 [Actinomycetota bacterium]|nr:hypothetical protein [Actinomycetota bacterium]